MLEKCHFERICSFKVGFTQIIVGIWKNEESAESTMKQNKKKMSLCKRNEKLNFKTQYLRKGLSVLRF